MTPKMATDRRDSGKCFGPSWALKGSAKVRPLMTSWIYKPNAQQDLRRTMRVATPRERLSRSRRRHVARPAERLDLAKPNARTVAHPLHGAAPLMVLRLHSPDADQAAASGVDPSRRLNLLLTYGGWRENAFADQIPLILNRFGIRCYRAESGDEASDVIRSERVHIAVIDLSIPMHPTRSQPTGTRAVPAGPRVLQLLRRLEQPPPTIVGARSRAANAHLRHCQQQSFPRFFHRNNKSHGACYIKLEHIIDLKQHILQQHAALALGAGAVMQRLCEVHNAGTNVDAA